MFRNWGLVLEHFEHEEHQTELNFTRGNKGEYLFLAVLFGLAPIVWMGRKHNEQAIANEIVATNTYSRINLDEKSARPSSWTA